MDNIYEKYLPNELSVMSIKKMIENHHDMIRRSEILKKCYNDMAKEYKKYKEKVKAE